MAILKKIELLVEDKTVDLFGDESFPISFTIDEISDVGKKAASFSKQISLPATDNNNEIFTSLFDVTVEGGFNPISRKRAVLYVDGVAIMQGYFKMLSVNINENEYPTYQGLLYEEQINFLAALDDFYLENLSIPLTGGTANYASGTTQVATFSFTGINSWNPSTYKIRDINGNVGSSNGDSLYFTGIDVSNPVYGIMSQQPGNNNYFSAGFAWRNADGTQYLHNAYEALQDQVINMNINLVLTSINVRGSYRTIVYVSRYNPSISGQYTDQVIFNQIFQGTIPTAGNTTSVANISINNLDIQLNAGDKVRIELFGTSSMGLIQFGQAGAQTISGTISIPNAFTPVYYRPTFTSIVDNINTVEDSDDFPIVYPIIDYSENYTFNNNKLSTFYDYNSLGQNKLINIDVDNLRPTVFVKQVWDAIFRQAGFKYKSNFLNSPTFKKMVLAGGIGEEEISSLVYYARDSFNLLPNSQRRVDIGAQDKFGNVPGYWDGYQYAGTTDSSFGFSLCDVTLTSGSGVNTTKTMELSAGIDAYMTPIPSHRHFGIRNSVVGIVNNVPFYYGYDMLGFNNRVVNDVNPGIFPTAAKDGKYRVKAGIKFNALQPTIGGTPSSSPVEYSLVLLKLTNGSYKYSPGASAIPTIGGIGTEWEELKSTRITRPGGTGTPVYELLLDENIELKKGDMIRVVLIANTGSVSVQSSITVDTATDQYASLEVYRYGSVLNSIIENAASLLPRKFKQRDFILELAKMFNLYFEVDKEDPKTLIIEPRDTYYETGIIRNWERKIDYTKEFKMDILSHEYPKTQIFKYVDDDDDYLSTRYAELSNNKLIFGSYIYTSQNEYNINEEQLELKFAPSYIQRLPDSNIKITKIHLPELYDVDYVRGKKVKYKVKPRIMMYKKMGNITQGYRLTMSQPVPNPLYKPLSGSGIEPFPINTYVQQSVPITSYGYAGHLDDPNNPTFDLNWFTDFNYLPNTTGTTQNLFNIFYKQQMIELTDQSARKVECFVDLTPVDIANLRFADIYYFNNEYWRLLEISDYDTSSDVKQTTKCTFIKIVRAQTNQLIDYATFGYLGINGGTGGGLIGGVETE